RLGVQIAYEVEVLELKIRDGEFLSATVAPADEGARSEVLGVRGDDGVRPEVLGVGGTGASSPNTQHLTPNTRVEVRAQAVVVASGGFEANLAWLKEYWGDDADNFIIRGTPYNQGRMLRELLDGGAKPVGNPREAHAVAVDARAPKFDGGIVTRLDSVP